MSPSHDVSSTAQRATHPRLHIRNAHDAHTLFEAVRLGHLPIVRRRLSPSERELQSGEIFVWEEASYKGGLERWTDGRKWSQSRMREPFLFYEEKVMPSREEKDAKAARRACKTTDLPGPSSSCPSDSSDTTPVFRRQDRPTKVKGLTKQTYSAFVHPPESNAPPKKWHLTAYFSTSDYHELPVVTQDPILRNIVVPKGVYVTGKGLTRKGNRGIGGSSAAHEDHAPYSDATSTFSSSFDSPAPSTRPTLDSPATTAYTRTSAPTPPQYSLPPTGASQPAPAPIKVDEGSRSPWSSSSATSLPVTPPQLASSLSPHHHYHLAPSEPSRQHPPHSYYGTQQQQHPSYHDSRPRSAHSPMVYDSTPRPSSGLPQLRASGLVDGYEKSSPSPPSHHFIKESPISVPPLGAPALPPVPSFLPSFRAGPPPHLLGPFNNNHSNVGYPSSDVRGEYYSPRLISARQLAPSTSSSPSNSGSRYTPRSSTDEKLLGAFKVAL